MRNAKKRTPNLLVVRFNTDFGQAQKQGCEPLGAKSCSNVKGPVCASYVFVTNCVLIGIYVRHWLPQRAALHKFLSANWLLYDFPTENVLFWFFLLFCFTFGFAFLHGQFEMKENDESMTQRPSSCRDLVRHRACIIRSHCLSAIEKLNVCFYSGEAFLWLSTFHLLPRHGIPRKLRKADVTNDRRTLNRPS